MAAKVGGRLGIANQSAEQSVSASSYATTVWFVKQHIWSSKKSSNSGRRWLDFGDAVLRLWAARQCQWSGPGRTKHFLQAKRAWRHSVVAELTACS